MVPFLNFNNSFEVNTHIGEYSSMYIPQTECTCIVNIQVKEKHGVSSPEALLQSPSTISHPPSQGDH